MVLTVPLLDVVDRQSRLIAILWMFPRHVRHYAIRLIVILQLKIQILAKHAIIN